MLNLSYPNNDRNGNREIHKKKRKDDKLLRQTHSRHQMILPDHRHSPVFHSSNIKRHHQITTQTSSFHLAPEVPVHKILIKYHKKTH